MPWKHFTSSTLRTFWQPFRKKEEICYLECLQPLQYLHCCHVFAIVQHFLYIFTSVTGVAFEESPSVSNSKELPKKLTACVADWLLSQSLIMISLTTTAFLISYHTGNQWFHSAVISKNIKDILTCHIISENHICNYTVIPSSSWTCLSHSCCIHGWATNSWLCASSGVLSTEGTTGRICPPCQSVIMPCVFLTPFTTGIYGWLHWVMVHFPGSDNNRIG